MKRFFLLLFLFAATAHAQSFLITGTASPTAGVIGYNVYRANCTGIVTSGVCSTDSTAVFSKLAAGASMVVTSLTDSTAVAGNSYIYYVTAVCPTSGPCQGESAPSNHLAVSIPPAPPSGVTLTSVTAIANPDGTQTITAKWSDTNPVQQTFSFSDGLSVKNQGLTSSSTGTFAERYTAIGSATIYFTVCDAAGQCASQKAM